MSAAQRDLLIADEFLDEFPGESLAETASRCEAPGNFESEAAAPFALKEQVAQRLAAHRARRGQTSGPAPVTPIAKSSPARSRSAHIAAAVAERYANSQTYRAFLAAEAENAIRQAEAAQQEAEAAAREAEAAASVAAISARAVADAQYELLAELDQWALTPAAAPDQPSFHGAPWAPVPNSGAAPFRMAPGQGLTVRIFEEPIRPDPPPATQRSRQYDPLDEEEGYALDEEIAFRQAPVFDEYRIVPGEIAANLIEFPRQLVAARRARPRLAEGPLREEADHAPNAAQLRIFEVESSHISTAVSPVESALPAEPEWTSILLAAHPVSHSTAASHHPVFSTQFATEAAPLRTRLMAGAVDAFLIAATLAASVAAIAYTFGKVSAQFYPGSPAIDLRSSITLPTAAIATVATLAVLALVYQLLFFTFSEATPGMRYARIALCTFNDANPTRRRMRRRIVAILLAACPLGIGFLWACLDEEGLGWHDRISRMYQRSY